MIRHGDRAHWPIVVLVTGFGAFPGAPSNPSAVVLAKLQRHRPRLARLGLRLETMLLPVVYAAFGTAMETVATQTRPDVILHVGLAGRRPTVCVETRALNRASPLHPDAARKRPAQILKTGGPAILPATYPAARIAAAVHASGLPVTCSIDAGDYVCNATLYATLLKRIAPIAGFLHVPRTRKASQPARHTWRRHPTADDLTRGLLAAIVVAGRDARRHCRART